MSQSFDVLPSRHIIMVEGPGCMLKGQKMKGRMKGKTVRAVAGNAVDRVCVYIVFI